MEGRIFASFHSTERSEPEELIEPTLSVCAKLGLASKSSTPLDPAEITFSDRNRVVVYDGNRQVRLNFRIGDWSGAIDSMLNIKTPANGFVSTDADPDNEYTGFARDFVNLIRDLTVELDPVYVSTHNTHVEPNTPSPETVIPFETPIELERIPWLGVYSEPLIDWFGGRDHVLETPAWKVTELENGSILIITTRTPWKGYHSKLPADDHLVDHVESREAANVLERGS